MLKRIALRFMLVLGFLGIGLPCFSEEFQHELKEWQYECLTYFGKGAANLLSQKPWRALENLQCASALLDKSDPSTSIISFLISFGQVVAYDCLGFREQCKQAIGSMFLAIDEYDEEESMETSEETDSTPQEYESSVEFLRSLAAIAPTREIRELLFSIIDGIAEQLLPAFEFAKSPFSGNGNWVFDYGTDDISITQCKSWWKKLKKWAYEVLELLDLVDKGTKSANHIKKNLEDLKRSNQYNDPRNIDPNYRIN